MNLISRILIGFGVFIQLVAVGQPLPLAYYSFTGGSTSSGLPATTTGIANGVVSGNTQMSLDRCGAANGSFDYDGISDRIDLSTNSIFDFTTSFTLAVWINTPYADQELKIINKTDNSVFGYAGNGFSLGIRDNSVDGEVFLNGNEVRTYNNTLPGFTPIQNNVWTHIAVTFSSSGTLKAFKNGVLISNTSLGSITVAGNCVGKSLLLGATTWPTTLFDYGGLIDEVYISNVELSPAQVTSLYDSYPKPTSISSPLAVYPSPCPFGNQELTVNTISGESITYQWLKNNSIIDNTTDGGIYGNSYNTQILSITGVPTSLSGANFKSIATGSCGIVTSSGISLSLKSVVGLNALATSVTGCLGTNRSISVTTNSGSNISSFQWYGDFGMLSNDATYSGVDTRTLTISGLSAALNNTNYLVVVGGACGFTTSTGSTLKVLPNTSVTGAVDFTGCTGATAVFTSATLPGVAINSYRWMRSTDNGLTYNPVFSFYPYSGANTFSLSIANINASFDNNLFVISVNGACGNFISTVPGPNSLSGARLRINTGASIAGPPANNYVCQNSNITISVTASGTSLTYQWRKNGTPIIAGTDGGIYSNFTTSNLLISNAPSSISGAVYDCDINSACGPSTSTGATLYVNDPPSITVQPSATISTCNGTNTFISVNAAGAGLIYRWLYNDGSGYKLITSSGVNLSVTGFTSNLLSLYNVSTSISGYTFMSSITGSCIPSVSSNAATLTVNPGPDADFVGLKAKYCANDLRDTLIGLSAATPGGVWRATPSAPNPFLTSTGYNLDGKVIFNPGVYNQPSTSVKISYITNPNAQNCVSTIDYTTLVYSTTGFGTQITQPSNAAFPGNGTAVNLAGTAAVAGTGNFYGEGVIGNQFFPNIVAYDKTYKLTYVYSQDVTGCRDSVFKDLFVYNPSGSVFSFEPTPTLAGSTFCQNDSLPRKIIYATSIPGNTLAETSDGYSYTGGYTSDYNYPILNYNYNYQYNCNKTYAITIVGNTGVSGIFRDLNSFSITPSGIDIGIVNPNVLAPRNFDLIYAYESFVKSEIYTQQYSYVTGTWTYSNQPNPSNACLPGGTRVYPNIWRIQPITINPKPALPNMPNTTVNICFGTVNSRTIKISGHPSASYKWYDANNVEITSLSGTNTSVPITQFGVNNASAPGTYKFKVKQIYNGCSGDLLTFYIVINPYPAAPTPNTPTLFSFCDVSNTGSTYIFTTMGINTTPGATYKWFLNSTLSGIYSTNNTFNYFIYTYFENRRDYYAVQSINGCDSPPTRFVMTVNSAPLPPSVTNNLISDCQKVPASNIVINTTATGIYPLGLTFEWYNKNPTIGAATLLGIGLTTQSGSNHLDRFNTGITTADTSSKTSFFGITSNNATGCRSITASQIDTRVYETPSAPISSNLGPLCSNLTGFAPAFIATSNYSNTVFKWYNNSSLTGSEFVGSSFNTFTPLSAPVDKNVYVVQVVNGCQSQAKMVNLKINSTIAGPNIVKPLLLLTIPGVYCQYQNVLSEVLTAVGINSLVGYNWYVSTVSGASKIGVGNRIFVSNINSFSTSVPGISTYYARQTLPAAEGGCESYPTSFTLVVKPTPIAPTTFDRAYCESVNGGNLFVNAPDLGISPVFTWYDMDSKDILGTGSTSILGPNYYNSIVHTFTGFAKESKAFGVSQTWDGCEGPIAIANLNVYPKPSVPVSDSLLYNDEIKVFEYCSGSKIREVKVSTSTGISSSSIIKWYDVNGIIGYGTKIQPDVNSILGWVDRNFVAKYLYATNTEYSLPGINFNGCESDTTTFKIVVKAIPPKPTVAGLSVYCSEANYDAVTALGVNDSKTKYLWYTSSDTNTYQYDGKIYKPTINAQTNYPTPSISYDFFVRQTYNECSSKLTSHTFTFNSYPVISISGIGNKYCEYDDQLTITGYHIPNAINSGGFSSPNLPSAALLNLGVDKGVFKPQQTLLNDSSKIFTLFYSAAVNGCSTQDSIRINLHPKPIVQIIGLAPDTCAYNNVQILLNAIPSGGVFSMIPSVDPGISGNSAIGYRFITDLAGIGDKKIQYQYNDQFTGCTNSDTATIKVNPLPIVDFIPTRLCQFDSVTFINKSTINGLGNIVSWDWTIDRDTSVEASPKYVFKKQGTYEATLYAYSDEGCYDYKTIEFNIGAKPKANFTFKNICNGDITQFTDISTIDPGAGKINRWKWNFGSSSGNISNIKSPQFKYSDVGSYQASLIVSFDTTNANCSDTLLKTISILPKISSYPYFQDFDVNSGGWYTEGTNNSWVYGQPSKDNIKIKSESDQFWVTDLNPQKATLNESSFVYGPCFDFSFLQRPMVSFDLNYRTKPDRKAGAVLQYSTDGGNIWKPIGDYYQPNNYYWKWFNNTNILSDPGEQSDNQTKILNSIGPGYKFPQPQIGWSGNSNGWVNSRHVLDSLSTNTSVRIRFAYSTLADNDSSQINEGFAYDNFWIGDRTKTVLLENFTNSKDYSSAFASYIIDSLINREKDNVVAIQYHTSFPYDDSFNQSNPADPSSRVLYYGIQSVPRATLDGNIFNTYYGYNTVSQPSTFVQPIMINDRSLETPPFSIDLSTSINNSSDMIVNGTFIANQFLNNTEYVAHLAVVEREVSYTEVTGGITKNKFEFVMKAMLPSAAGTSFFGSWAPGQKQQVSQSWNISNVNDKTQLGIVAFIQNRATKEVLQARYIGPKMSTVNKTYDETDSVNLTVYPNPAQDIVNIVYPIEAGRVYNYSIIDQMGRIVSKGVSIPGSGKTLVNTINYPNGIYQVLVNDQVNHHVLITKISIVH